MTEKKKLQAMSLRYMANFLLSLPAAVSPEAFLLALKVLITLINAKELRCKTFVDISLL